MLLKTPPKIRKNIEIYRKTKKGKAACLKAQKNYRAKNKAARQTYDKSPKGRAVNKKAVAKYARTAKGKAARERATINYIIKKSKEESMIDLKGKDKAAVLAKLYNASQPQGMSFLHYQAKDMTNEEAQKILDKGQTYFDYLFGRVMKIDLGSDKLNPSLYDRDNGSGAAARALGC